MPYLHAVSQLLAFIGGAIAAVVGAVVASRMTIAADREARREDRNQLRRDERARFELANLIAARTALIGLMDTARLALERKQANKPVSLAGYELAARDLLNAHGLIVDDGLRERVWQCVSAVEDDVNGDHPGTDIEALLNTNMARMYKLVEEMSTTILATMREHP